MTLTIGWSHPHGRRFARYFTELPTAVIEAAITPRTKALVVVHYAGVACNMDAIKAICLKHKILLIEDAAHAFGAATTIPC